MKIVAILIKGVDPKLYAMFKAKAIGNGLKIGEAFEKAIKIWLSEKEPLNERDVQQEHNWRHYRQIKATIKKENKGKWLSITDGEIEFLCENNKDLLEEIKRSNRIDKVRLVINIGKEPYKRTLGFRRIIR